VEKLKISICLKSKKGKREPDVRRSAHCSGTASRLYMYTATSETTMPNSLPMYFSRSLFYCACLLLSDLTTFLLPVKMLSHCLSLVPVEGIVSVHKSFTIVNYLCLFSSPCSCLGCVLTV
jgi:hypothetical protein